jgi:hypothetical protein
VFQPVSTGLPEKPNPGIEGMTTSNESSGLPPWAVGSVKGPTTLSISNTDPGQPWVMITGKALGCFERKWMKWMSTPSMRVMNCGSALSFASAFRQS